MGRSRIVRGAVGMMVMAGSMTFGQGVSSGATPAGPFVTSERPFLVPILPGVMIEPVLTTGDVIGQGNSAYQMSGVPDGIGWFSSADGDRGLLQPRAEPEIRPVRLARVPSHAEHRRGGHGRRVRDRRNGELRVVLLEHARGDRRGALVLHRRGVHPEPAARHLDRRRREHRPSASRRRSSAISATRTSFRSRVSRRRSSDCPRMASVRRRSSTRTSRAVSTGAIHGDEGSLRVWLPDEPVADGNPSSDDIAKGETMSGHFVRIPNAADLMPGKLDARMQEIGAFDFTGSRTRSTTRTIRASSTSPSPAPRTRRSPTDGSTGSRSIPRGRGTRR